MSVNQDFEDFLDALNYYHEVALKHRDPDNAEVLDAADAVIDAFTIYDESLYTDTGVDLPLDSFEADEEVYDEVVRGIRGRVYENNEADDDYDDDDFDDDYDEDYDEDYDDEEDTDWDEEIPEPANR